MALCKEVGRITPYYMIFLCQKLDTWFSLEVFGVIPTRQSSSNSYFGFVLILGLEYLVLNLR